MFVGASGPVAADRAGLTAGWRNDGGHSVEWVGGDGVVAGIRPWAVKALDSEERWATDPATGSWLVVSGHLFRDSARGEADRPQALATTLLARLTDRGLACRIMPQREIHPGRWGGSSTHAFSLVGG